MSAHNLPGVSFNEDTVSELESYSLQNFLLSEANEFMRCFRSMDCAFVREFEVPKYARYAHFGEFFFYCDALFS